MPAAIAVGRNPSSGETSRAKATTLAGGKKAGGQLDPPLVVPAGYPVPAPGHACYLTMGIGLVASLLAILASLPLPRRLTGPGKVRFE